MTFRGEGLLVEVVCITIRTSSSTAVRISI